MMTTPKCIQEQLQDTEKRLAEGWAVLNYLQDQLTDVACDDPGTTIGAWLALPILQVGCAYLGHMCCDRLDSALPYSVSEAWLCATSTRTVWLALHLREDSNANSCLVSDQCVVLYTGLATTAFNDPRGQQTDSQAAGSATGSRACDGKGKHLVAIADSVLGHLQQPSQRCAEPSEDACSCAEGGARAALAADRTPECVTPEPAEHGLLLRLAPLSPLPEPAQEAPAAASGLQDMLGLLLPPVLRTAGHNVPSQQLSQP